MVDLDDLDSLKDNDPQDMLTRIAELPRQCRDAWQNIEGFDLPPHYREVDKVVILGMGGSAISGDLLRTLVKGECPVPILVNRDYDVPAFVNGQALAIASSYSGDTEETLLAFEEALERGAKVLALTTGGKLAEQARKAGVPLLAFSYPSQPRAALGHSLVLLVGTLQKLGLITDKLAKLEEAVAVMEGLRARIKETIPLVRNPAKQLAQKVYGHLPVVYGAEHLSEVAHRWKTQFNENSKAYGFYEVLPELNHNAVVGYQFPDDLTGKAIVIMLTSSRYHPRNRVRCQVTQEILAKRGITYEVVEALGESPLAQVLSMVHLGDYVSYYLAMLYGVDPTSIETIVYLKERLAQAG